MASADVAPYPQLPTSPQPIEHAIQRQASSTSSREDVSMNDVTEHDKFRYTFFEQEEDDEDPDYRGIDYLTTGIISSYDIYQRAYAATKWSKEHLEPDERKIVETKLIRAIDNLKIRSSDDPDIEVPWTVPKLKDDVHNGCTAGERWFYRIGSEWEECDKAPGLTFSDLPGREHADADAENKVSQICKSQAAMEAFQEFLKDPTTKEVAEAFEKAISTPVKAACPTSSFKFSDLRHGYIDCCIARRYMVEPEKTKYELGNDRYKDKSKAKNIIKTYNEWWDMRVKLFGYPSNWGGNSGDLILGIDNFAHEPDWSMRDGLEILNTSQAPVLSQHVLDLGDKNDLNQQVQPLSPGLRPTDISDIIDEQTTAKSITIQGQKRLVYACRETKKGPQLLVEIAKSSSYSKPAIGCLVSTERDRVASWRAAVGAGAVIVPKSRHFSSDEESQNEVRNRQAFERMTYDEFRDNVIAIGVEQEVKSNGQLPDLTYDSGQQRPVVILVRLIRIEGSPIVPLWSSDIFSYKHIKHYKAEFWNAHLDIPRTPKFNIPLRKSRYENRVGDDADIVLPRTTGQSARLTAVEESIAPMRRELESIRTDVDRLKSIESRMGNLEGLMLQMMEMQRGSSSRVQQA